MDSINQPPNKIIKVIVPKNKLSNKPTKKQQINETKLIIKKLPKVILVSDLGKSLYVV